jgi:hypothetical protein
VPNKALASTTTQLASAVLAGFIMMRSMPLSPVADEPDEPPPREAVVSGDTKTYDRGRRKGTPPPPHMTH